MSAINTGSFEAFCAQWKCTREERNLLILYLAVIRLHAMLTGMQTYLDHRFMIDGDGI